MHINCSHHNDGKTVTMYLLAARSEEELLRASGLAKRAVYPRRTSSEPWMIEHLLDWQGAQIAPVNEESADEIVEVVRRECLYVADDLAIYTRSNPHS